MVDLDTLLSEREHLNASLQEVIDAQTEPWGIKVTTVEIKDVEIPERMQHAIARQAEAERERRAKIINAEGEAQAAAKLAEAADVIGRNPVTLQLRYLQTLREIGGGQNSTIVFPVDVVRPVIEALGGAAAASARGAGGRGSAVGHRGTRRDGRRIARGGTPRPAGPGSRWRRPPPMPRPPPMTRPPPRPSRWLATTGQPVREAIASPSSATSPRTATSLRWCTPGLTSAE